MVVALRWVLKKMWIGAHGSGEGDISLLSRRSKDRGRTAQENGRVPSSLRTCVGE